MIYLKVIGNSIQAFADLHTLTSITGFASPDLEVTEEQWESSHNQARLENGKIVLDSNKEVLFSTLRSERNQRLEATDYLMLADYPISDTSRKAVVEYRQALRNLPSQKGAPWDGGGPLTPWPTFPEI